MRLFKGNPVKIAGTGKYIPEKVLTNFDIEKIVDTNNEWILERTGIKKRHFAAPDQKCSDLAYLAALDAIADAKIDPAKIDAVIVATNSPETICPCMAAKVQGRIGATSAGAYDVISGCTGSLTAMLTAIAGISSGIWEHALVIGSEDFADIINWEDRSTCILFGDGAGACVLSRAEEGEGRFAAGEILADGTKYELLTFEDEGSEHHRMLHMKGSEVFKFVNTHLPPFIKNFCAESGVTPQDIDFWVLHQANTRIIDGLFRRLSVEMERTLTNLENYGNTSAASLLITLDEAMKAGKINSGEKIMFTSFGAGMTLGALLYEA